MAETLNYNEAEILEHDVEGGIIRVIPQFTGKPHVPDITQMVVEIAADFGEIATIDSMYLRRPIPSDVELKIVRRNLEQADGQKALCTVRLTTEGGEALCASFFPYNTGTDPISSYMPLFQIEPESASDSHNPVSSVCVYATPSSSENTTAYIFSAINDSSNRCTACSLENYLETLKGSSVYVFTRYGSLDIGLVLQTTKFSIVSNLWNIERRANGYLYFTTSYIIYDEDGTRLCSGDVEKAIILSSYFVDS
ncbi:hypothetical protein ACFL21_04785 [Patescibacteria group bacterium]